MKRSQIEQLLKQNDISYQIEEHPEALAIEAIEQFNLAYPEAIVKNLFVRDDKKQSFYLITCQKDKRVNLKELAQIINSRPLSFASEKYLTQYLSLNPGEVTPFGLLNNEDGNVTWIVDDEIMELDKIGVHPNENMATVWIYPEDLASLIEVHGNKVESYQL